MSAARTFTDKMRGKLRALHEQGLSLRQIAAELGFAPATVSKHAKAMGLTFDRTQTEAATTAHTFDLKTARLELLEGLVDVAKQELKRAREPYIVFSFGGQFNDYAEHTLPLPPAESVRSMQTTAAVALDKVQRDLDRQGDGSLQTVGAMIDRVVEQLGIHD